MEPKSKAALLGRNLVLHDQWRLIGAAVCFLGACSADRSEDRGADPFAPSPPADTTALNPSNVAATGSGVSSPGSAPPSSANNQSTSSQSPSATTALAQGSGDETRASDVASDSNPAGDSSLTTAPSTDGPTTLDGTADESTEPSPVASSDSPLGSSSDDGNCAFRGAISYTFNNASDWPADVAQKLSQAMDEAVYYYNCYSDLRKSLTINYNPGVPTAEGNVDGWITFGSDRNYMVTATAMHEIGHTLGVGYAPWSELIQNGRWVGPAVVEFMTNLPAAQRDPDMYSQRTYITCDNQHFWPYGLNQASEHQSEWSLINHVRIVAAMNADKATVRR